MSLLDLAKKGTVIRPYTDARLFEEDAMKSGPVTRRKFSAMQEYHIANDMVVGVWNHVAGTGEIYYDEEADRKRAIGANENGIVKASKATSMSSSYVAPLSESREFPADAYIDICKVPKGWTWCVSWRNSGSPRARVQTRWPGGTFSTSKEAAQEASEFAVKQGLAAPKASSLNESTAVSAHHLSRVAVHEAESKSHLDKASKLRAAMNGKTFGQSALQGEAASKHEYAAKVHSDAAQRYRQGDGGSGRVFGKSAKLHSENANKFSQMYGLQESKQSIDWHEFDGDWNGAKKAAERAFESYKTARNTDAVLKLKTEAATAQKKGSYIGAVLVGLANDYFDRLK